MESKIYDDFVSLAKSQAESKRLGNPFDKNTDQGPQVDEDQLNTILRYINIGKKEGAQLVTGFLNLAFLDQLIFVQFRRFSIWRQRLFCQANHFC